ncbi:MAG: AzlC family ABC transporter permease [Trueperaceae bacterium]|nr:AzlC family ABC transporter permease [Trueperaceae bacterium]
MTGRQAFAAGFRDILPFLLGTIPFGLIAGVSGIGIGMQFTEVVFMSGFLYAGASQLAAYSLMSTGAAVWVIVLTIAMVNLRLVMYSASIAPWLREYGMASRLLMAGLMVDQSFALGVLRYAREAEGFPRRAYMLGMESTMWVTWMASCTIGALAGARLPAEWQLDFAVPLCFLAMLVPIVRTPPMLAAATVGGGLAVALSWLPYNLGLVIGAICGIYAGVLAEGMQGRRSS